MTTHSSAEISVATWNVHGCRTRTGGRFMLQDRIGTVTPDILALQEVELQGPSESSRGSIQELRTASFESTAVATFSASPFSPQGQLAVALMSKARLRSRRALTFPNVVSSEGMASDFHDKGIVFAEVQVGDAVVDVASLHLFPFHRVNIDERDERLLSFWAQVDSMIRPRPTVPRIVMGDFNSVHRYELLPSLREGELHGLFRGAPTRDDGRPHDDILVTRDWVLLEAENVRTESDHNFLSAKLRLEVI